MLSEILEAYAPKIRKARPGRAGISISSLFPCPYRLRRVHEGTYWPKEQTAQQFYNMQDGWDQEEQSVRRLAAAGVEIVDRQNKVFVGKSMVPGSYDGAFTLNGRKHLWEHKAYDSLAQAVQFLQQWGMDKLPAQKAQTNAYMVGAGLEYCDFFVKIKNNNTYLDVVYQLDHEFIDPIIEWCDRIRIDNWKPEPEEGKWCSLCGVNCFSNLLDLSWIAAADEKDIADKWLTGKRYIEVGKALQEEADAALIGVKDRDGHFIQKGLIGDKDILLVPGLEIKKTSFPRSDVDKSLILQEFGAEGLAKVLTEKTITQYRHKEV